MEQLTKEQWEAEIEPYGNAAGLSTSSVAEWKIWRDLSVALALRFQKILFWFKGDIDNTLATKQPTAISWYADVAKEFQLGYNLITVNNIPKYEVIDDSPAVRIVTHSAAKEIGDLNIIIAVKVAKTVGGNLAPLSAPELAEFTTYMKARRAPGVSLNAISIVGDIIQYTITGHFDPLYSVANVYQGIDNELIFFKDNFRFDAVFYKAQLIDKLQSVPGVVALSIGLKYWDGLAFVDFDFSHELPSGYFNWGGLSSLSLTIAP